jgi:hypothetical protein
MRTDLYLREELPKSSTEGAQGGIYILSAISIDHASYFVYGLHYQKELLKRRIYVRSKESLRGM